MGNNGGYIYFIDNGYGAIKIGFAQHVPSRLNGLQSAYPTPLELLGSVPGTEALEQEYQELFGPSKLKGEWFTKTPALLSFIAKVTGNEEILSMIPSCCDDPILINKETKKFRKQLGRQLDSANISYKNLEAKLNATQMRADNEISHLRNQLVIEQKRRQQLLDKLLAIVNENQV